MRSFCKDPRCDAGCIGLPVRSRASSSFGVFTPADPSPMFPTLAGWTPDMEVPNEDTSVREPMPPGTKPFEVVELPPGVDPRAIVTKKPTNPKDRIGVRKAGMSFVPQVPLAELGVAMVEGALKYGPFNWREAGVRSSVYFDAVTRHIRAWWEGEEIDPDSGLSHLVKAMACLVVIRDAQVHHMVEDDRPPTDVDVGAVLRQLDTIAAGLIDRYRPETDQPQEDKT